MAKGKKPAFKPKAGQPVGVGVPTQVGTSSGQQVEYLSPKKTAPPQRFPPIPPPPAELRSSTTQTTLEGQQTEVPSAAQPSVDDTDDDSDDAEENKPHNTPPSVTMSRFLKRWAAKVLNVFYQREADPKIGQPCPECHGEWRALYRCTECHGNPVFCAPCVTRCHERLPLHRVDRWSGSHFEPIDLADIGFTINLGHDGRRCEYLRPSDKSLHITVVHTNGLHKARLFYCRCPDALERPLQLWQLGWWPASFKRTRTVFTYTTLRFYDRLSLQAKTSCLDFWNTLRRLTNHAFPTEVKNRYAKLLDSYRQFSYIQAVRRAGQVPAEKLPPGSLAILCPACPQPGINMDPNWRNRPESEHYLDALYVGKDGNFVLSHHSKPLDQNDRSMFDGAAYIADNDEYAAFMEAGKNDEELERDTEICSDFKAGKTRYSGKIKSGVITLTCLRHGFALPCGTVDVDDGEKYKHVDFATVSGMRWWLLLLLFFISYDVNCIYEINWLTRLAKMTGADKIWPKIRRCIPKWHHPAHTGICQWLMSFYFMPGAGQTDGEEPERRWSVMNAIGRIIREMLAGHRHDTLNLHYADYNMQKLFGIAAHLAKKLKEAITFSATEKQHLAELEQTLLESNMPLNEWKAREKRYQEQLLDPSVDRKSIENPYEPAAGNEPTLKEVKAMWNHKEITVERPSKRKRKAKKSDQTDDSEPPTVGGLFLQALDIERDQRAVKILLATEESQNTVDATREQLERKLEIWHQSHDQVLGPQVAELRSVFPDAAWPEQSNDCQPEDEVLPLPSTYPDCVRNHVLFAAAVEAERSIRRAQASDALQAVRHKLGLKSFLWKKTSGTFGQNRKTRNQKLLANVDDEVEQYRQEYKRVRAQLLLIAEENDRVNYPDLTKEDCTMLNLYHEQEMPGQRKKELSWLWRRRVYKDEDVNKYESEGVRVEWFRKSARCARWAEEVELRKEEMRRTQRYFRYFSEWWGARSRPTAYTWAELGKAAYASRKSAMFSKLLTKAQQVFPKDLLV